MPLDLDAIETRLLALHNRAVASPDAAAFLTQDVPYLLQIARAAQAVADDFGLGAEGETVCGSLPVFDRLLAALERPA